MGIRTSISDLREGHNSTNNTGLFHKINFLAFISAKQWCSTSLIIKKKKKAKQSRVNSLRSTNLNNSGGFQAIGMVSSYQISDLGVHWNGGNISSVCEDLKRRWLRIQTQDCLVCTSKACSVGKLLLSLGISYLLERQSVRPQEYRK